MTSNQLRVIRYAGRGALLGGLAGAVLLAWMLIGPAPTGPGGDALGDAGVVVLSTLLGWPVSLMLSLVLGGHLSAAGDGGSAWSVHAWVIASPALGCAFWGAVVGLLRIHFNRQAERRVAVYRDRTG